MNDMTSSLMGLGVQAENMDAILMGQAVDRIKFVDLLTLRPHLPLKPLLGRALKIRIRDFLKGGVVADKMAMSLEKCERKRCRDALASEGLRREFARRFGSALAKRVDLVVCNFPTWQCSLFMYVHVAVVMRFTHRWDHHLQGTLVDPGASRRPAQSWSELASSSFRPSAEFNRSRSEALHWRRLKGHGAAALKAAGLYEELAATAHTTLNDMAARPNVVVAASNPYDFMYLRRSLGVQPVPWPGTASQLVPVPYTGDHLSSSDHLGDRAGAGRSPTRAGRGMGRAIVLFCCGI